MRVRWRSSASVPLSTVLPARMMLTRSQSSSTSERMWLDSSTVAPSAADAGDLAVEDQLHERVEAARRLVEEVEVGGRREGGDERDLLPVALRVGAALLARVELEHLA